MPASLTRRRSRRAWLGIKPGVGFGLDPSHPLVASNSHFWPLNEGGGTSVVDAATRRVGSFVGTPTWAAGPGLNGFTTANYVAVNPPTPILGVTYPFWAALEASCTASTRGFPWCQGYTLLGNPFVCVDWNYTGNNTINYALRDDSGTGTQALAGVAIANLNDGQRHIVQVVSYTASDHRLYFDGAQVLAYTTTVGSMSINQLAIGVLARNSISLPFAGTVYGFACGNGIVPDPRALAADFYGPFLAPAPRRRYVAAGGGSPGNAGGAAPAVSLAGIAGTATGAASATGNAPAVSLVAPAGVATGAASAAGTCPALSLTSAAGTATGDAAAAGTAPALSLAAPTAAATGVASATGACPALSLVGIAGAATGDAAASGTAPALSLSAPGGTAAGASSATGACPALSLVAPSGTATGAAAASAACPALSLSAPAGVATGGAAASGTAPALSLVAPAGSAVGGNAIPGDASGLAPALSLASATGTATGAASATGTAPGLSLSAPAGVATGGAVASGAAPRLSLSAPFGAALGDPVSTPSHPTAGRSHGTRGGPDPGRSHRQEAG